MFISRLVQSLTGSCTIRTKCRRFARRCPRRRRRQQSSYKMLEPVRYRLCRRRRTSWCHRRRPTRRPLDRRLLPQPPASLRSFRSLSRVSKCSGRLRSTSKLLHIQVSPPREFRRPNHFPCLVLFNRRSRRRRRTVVQCLTGCLCLDCVFFFFCVIGVRKFPASIFFTPGNA
jgi:hypothetical protein